MDNSEMATEQKAAGGEANDNKNKTGIAVVFGIIEVIALVLWQTADDFSNPAAYWIHFFSKCGFLAGGAYLAHEFTKGIIWRVCIWAAFLFFCIVLFIIKPIQSTRPTFSIIALDTTIELKNPTRFLVWGNGSQSDIVVAPIPIVMWVEFTNLKDVSMSISSCQFECKSTNGTWVAMQVIDPSVGWIYSTRNGDLHHATRYDPGENVFPESFRVKDIRPGEPIAAWVFLEPPKNGFDGNIRFRIKDSADNESVEFVRQRSRTNMLATATLPAPPIRLVGPNDFGDISTARLVDYAQMFYPSDFAPSNDSPEKPGFKIELLIAYSILGFGIIWTCIGWIFFQKRNNCDLG